MARTETIVHYAATIKGANNQKELVVLHLNRHPVSGCDPYAWSTWAYHFLDKDECINNAKRLALPSYYGYDITKLYPDTLKIIKTTITKTIEETMEEVEYG